MYFNNNDDAVVMNTPPKSFSVVRRAIAETELWDYHICTDFGLITDYELLSGGTGDTSTFYKLHKYSVPEGYSDFSTAHISVITFAEDGQICGADYMENVIVDRDEVISAIYDLQVDTAREYDHVSIDKGVKYIFSGYVSTEQNELTIQASHAHALADAVKNKSLPQGVEVTRNDEGVYVCTNVSDTQLNLLFAAKYQQSWETSWYPYDEPIGGRDNVYSVYLQPGESEELGLQLATKIAEVYGVAVTF